MTSPTSPRRPRFSLLALVFTITTIALALGIWSVRRQNVRLRQRNETLESENAKYRDELGILEISDPLKIHAIRVEIEPESEWSRFRAYLPSMHDYVLKYSYQPIPKSGLPQDCGSLELKSGEILIDCAIKPGFDRKTGERASWATAELRVRGEQPAFKGTTITNGATIGIHQERNDWLLNKETGATSYTLDRIDRKVQQYHVTEPVVLYRPRAHKILPLQRNAEGRVTRWSTKEISEPCDGFMIWIEAVGGDQQTASDKQLKLGEKSVE